MAVCSILVIQEHEVITRSAGLDFFPDTAV